MWNRRDESVPWVAELSQIIHWNRGLIPEYDHVHLDGFTKWTCGYVQSLSHDGLLDRVASVSYIAAMDEHERAGVLAQVSELVARVHRADPAPVRHRSAHSHLMRDLLRDLPWRRTRDPWAVLVSEVMLQQTQVLAGRADLARVPASGSRRCGVCAAASQADVVTAWAGLGYNRRAVNLHRAAVAMGDEVPRDLDALLALPGIGAYTARAVLVFAFEEDVAVVDTNIARVLSRRAGRRLTAKRAAARGRRARARGSGVGMEPAPDGSRCPRVHGRDPSCDQCWFRDGLSVGRSSTGRRAGSRRSRGQIGRAVDASSPRSAPETCPCSELDVVMGWPDDRRPRGAASRRSSSTRAWSRSHQAVMRLTMSS